MLLIWIKNLAPQNQCLGLLAKCQYTVTESDSKLALLFQSSCGSMYNYLSRSLPEIHFACCWDIKQLRYKHLMFSDNFITPPSTHILSFTKTTLTDGWVDGWTMAAQLDEHDWLHRSICHLYGKRYHAQKIKKMASQKYTPLHQSMHYSYW